MKVDSFRKQLINGYCLNVWIEDEKVLCCSVIVLSSSLCQCLVSSCYILLYTLHHTLVKSHLDIRPCNSLPAEVLSAADLCKQFGPRSGPTKCRSWSGSKLIATLIAFLKEFLKKIRMQQKTCKITQFKCKELIKIAISSKTILWWNYICCFLEVSHWDTSNKNPKLIQNKKNRS